MRRSFFLVALLLAGLLLIPAPVWAAGYQGASQWAVPELDKALDYGLITDSIRGKMNASVTREEFAEIAVKLYENGTGDIAEAGDTSVFVDTRNLAVFKAYTLGIVNGTDAGRRLFSPNALITREQVAAMLYRTINAMGMRDDDVIAFAIFMDQEQIAPYALEAVHYMGGMEFIRGSAGCFNPRGTCTREMAVLIAARVFESANSGNAPSRTGELNQNNYYDDYYCEEQAPDDYSEPDDYGDWYSPDPTPNPTPQTGRGDAGHPSGNQPSLPENMISIFPLLNDAQIMLMDEWDGGDGTVFYTSNYSINKANEFYRDPTLYNNFIEMQIHSDTLEVITNGFYYVIKIFPNNWEQGGPTAVQLSVFWYVPA